MSIAKAVNERLSTLGEDEKIILTPNGCSINYLRHIVSMSSHGDFVTKYYKETGQLEVSRKRAAAIHISSSECDPNVMASEVADDEEDFRGF